MILCTTLLTKMLLGDGKRNIENKAKKWTDRESDKQPRKANLLYLELLARTKNANCVF